MATQIEQLAGRDILINATRRSETRAEKWKSRAQRAQAAQEATAQGTAHRSGDRPEGKAR